MKRLDVNFEYLSIETVCLYLFRKIILMAVVLMGLHVSAQDYVLTVKTIAELQAINPSALGTTNAVFVQGYWSPGDRGGGTFRWDGSSSATQDYGRYFTSPFTTGRWTRLLNGEAANVKMWGARGDAQGFSPTLMASATDDTVAIQNALNACAGQFWCTELVFPAGFYKVTDTLVCSAHLLVIRGEGGRMTKLVMQYGVAKDIFRTQNYNTVMNNGYIAYGQYDEWLRIDDIEFRFASSTGGATASGNATNTALGICFPQEGNTIKNFSTMGGGYGIRCLGGGNGAPAAFRDVVCSEAAVAGICIEPAPGTSVCGGEVSIVGLTGDYFVTTENTATLLKFVNYVGVASVQNLNAEGYYGGGVIQHKFPEPASGWSWNTPMGLLTIKSSTCNLSSTNGFLVLNGGKRTASVTIENVNIYGGVHLIVDNVSGRNVRPTDGRAEGLSQGLCRMPVQYEGFNAGNSVPGDNHGSRLVIGGNLTYSFIPPTNGWYRVLRNGPINKVGGRLVINGRNDSTEFSVQVPYGGSSGAQISVIRPTIDNGNYRPYVTKARAGCYESVAADGARGFVDIYVERLGTTGDWVTDQIVLSYPMDGQGINDNFPALLTPTAPLTSILPAGDTVLYQCVTNSLTQY